MMPRAIVFDLWFTLITPEDYRTPGVRTDTLISTALGVDPGSFQEFWSTSAPQRESEPRLQVDWIAEYLATQGRDMTDADRAAFDLVWNAHDMALASPRAGVVDAVARLRASGLHLGLLSNAHEREIRTFASSPLSKHFSAASFSCHIGHMKPDPAAYVHVLERLTVPPEVAVFVGDGASGELDGARRAGFGGTIFMRGLLAEGGVSDAVIQELAGQADAVIDQIEDLCDLLGAVSMAQS